MTPTPAEDGLQNELDSLSSLLHVSLDVHAAGSPLSTYMGSSAAIDDMMQSTVGCQSCQGLLRAQQQRLQALSRELAETQAQRERLKQEAEQLAADAALARVISGAEASTSAGASPHPSSPNSTCSNTASNRNPPAFTSLLSVLPAQPVLLDFFRTPGSSEIPEVRLTDLQQVAERENMLVMVYKFSELQPGQSLAEHVRQQCDAGICSYPSDRDCMLYMSPRMMRICVNDSLETAQRKDEAYWAGHAAFGPSHMTPIHMQQEWQTYMKNVLHSDNSRYVLRAVMAGKQGERDTVIWNAINLSCYLVDEDGRRYWGWVRQGWFAGMGTQAQWSVRDLHANKLTLFCFTYVARDTGVILAQNATSMATFGNHGLFNAEIDPSPDGGHPNGSAVGHNFLEMLFESRKDELARLPEVVGREVYRIDGLEIINPTLRSWMGVKPGQEVFHDVQVVCNQDPVTHLPVYAINQIDSTERVLAQRQLQQALHELAEDKERMAHLVQRQHDLIACLGKLNAMEKAIGGEGSWAAEALSNLKRQICSSSDAMMGNPGFDEDMHMMELLGAGSFGKVYRALWKGKSVAVKIVMLPLEMSANKKQEAMTMMEATVSTSLKHPNIVQTYTYHMQPVRQLALSPAETACSNLTYTPTCSMATKSGHISAFSSRHVSDDGSGGKPAAESDVRPHTPTKSDGPAAVGLLSPRGDISGFEVQLILELCDRGSLRHALDAQVFHKASGQLDYLAILETATDIARGMQHLHNHNIWHSDLKPLNTLLSSTSNTRRGFVAKISDFGLSLKVEPLQASLRGSVTGTGPYIAPEVLANGTRSAAADVYAFGITLWEMVTGGDPLTGVPKVMLAQQVVLNNLRPTFPAGVPPGFVALAQRCWAARPEARPTFEEVLTHLRRLMDEGPTEIPPVSAEALQIQSCAEEASWRELSVMSGSRETSPSLRLPAMQTPVERMLDLLETLLHGGDVDIKEVAKIHEAITSSWDVWQPADVARRMHHLHLDKDVSRSLLNLLSIPDDNFEELQRLRQRRVSVRLAVVAEDEREWMTPPSPGGDSSKSPSRVTSRGNLRGAPSRVTSMHDMVGAEALRALRAPSDPVLAVLAKADDWRFDPFELSDVTDGRPLSALCFALIRRLDLGSLQGRMGEVRLAKYLRTIEDGYRDLPYHNKVHAAGVVQYMYVLLTSGGVLRTAWAQDHGLVLLTAIFSAMVHDYEHLGLNNDFLVKTKHPLALVYNDRSPMEQHHLAAAFTLLQQADMNFLAGLPDDMQVAFRKQVIETVLATDMKQHFAIVSHFSTKFAPLGMRRTSSSPSSNGSPMATASAGSMTCRVPLSRRGSSRAASMASSVASMALSTRDAPLSLDAETLSLVMQLVMKCADLSNLAAEHPVYWRWAERLEQEMWIQGDCEREEGLDRHCPKGGVTRAQSGFFSVIGLPLFQALQNVFPDTAPMVEQAKANNAWCKAEGK